MVCIVTRREDEIEAKEKPQDFMTPFYALALGYDWKGKLGYYTENGVRQEHRSYTQFPNEHYKQADTA